MSDRGNGIGLEAALTAGPPAATPVARAVTRAPLTEDEHPIEILLVEDNPGDVRLMAEALKGYNVTLHVASDGERALAHLQGEADLPPRPRPDLILLDLNLPKKDGREVLAAIKEDSALNTIPIVVLTSSGAEADVRRSYELNANCYVSKPAALEEFLTVMKSIYYFWATVARLPAGQNHTL